MEQGLARWAHNPKAGGSNPSPAIFTYLNKSIIEIINLNKIKGFLLNYDIIDFNSILFFIKHVDTFVVAAIWCERIPIISAITSTVNLLLKSTIDSTSKSTLKNRFLVYLDKTDVKLFLWLFVPIIGNLVVFFYRQSCHHKQIGSEDKKLGSAVKCKVDSVQVNQSIALDATK